MTRQSVKREETKKRLVASASRNFRQHGFGSIGVDGIASSAKVTSGAFYSHLGSKNGAFIMALEEGLDEVIAAIPEIQKSSGSKWVESFANYYLGENHIKDMECGCAMASLTMDVVRLGGDNAKCFESRFAEIIELVSAGLSGSDIEDKHRRAWALLSLLVGGLTFVRALYDPRARKTASDAVIMSAIKVAGRAKKVA